MRTIKVLIRSLRTVAAGDDDLDAHVHFHRGPQGRPAVCHDHSCETPRLDVT
jgi:hypothetical protein